MGTLESGRLIEVGLHLKLPNDFKMVTAVNVDTSELSLKKTNSLSDIYLFRSLSFSVCYVFKSRIM